MLSVRFSRANGCEAGYARSRTRAFPSRSTDPTNASRSPRACASSHQRVSVASWSRKRQRKSSTDPSRSSSGTSPSNSTSARSIRKPISRARITTLRATSTPDRSSVRTWARKASGSKAAPDDSSSRQRSRPIARPSSAIRARVATARTRRSTFRSARISSTRRASRSSSADPTTLAPTTADGERLRRQVEPRVHRAQGPLGLRPVHHHRDVALGRALGDGADVHPRARQRAEDARRHPGRARHPVADDGQEGARGVDVGRLDLPLVALGVERRLQRGAGPGGGSPLVVRRKRKRPVKITGRLSRCCRRTAPEATGACTPGRGPWRGSGRW